MRLGSRSIVVADLLLKITNNAGGNRNGENRPEPPCDSHRINAKQYNDKIEDKVYRTGVPLFFLLQE
jgi:hypothetical protein